MHMKGIMKGLVFVCLTFLVFYPVSPLSGASAKAKAKHETKADVEANRLAREGTEAANNKDWDKAIESLRKASEIDHKYSPNLATALQQRAAAYLGDGKLQDALADLTEAIKIEPRDARIYESRAYAEMKANDLDKAQADYSEAIKLDPNQIRYYKLRSYIREVKGDYKGSMEDTDKVLQMDKNNAEAQARKARLEKRMAQSQPLSAPLKAPMTPAPPPRPH
jgi:tetratricopeptide (TPR) repeat protein